MGRLYCFDIIRNQVGKRGLAWIRVEGGKVCRYSPNSTESSPTLPSTHTLLVLLLLPPQTTTAAPPTSIPHAETPHYDSP